MREQERTGGLMALHELCQQVRKLRGVGSDPISQFVLLFLYQF